MATHEEKITSCHICPNHCFLNVTIEDGKIVEVKGAQGFPVHMCSVKKDKAAEEGGRERFRQMERDHLG